MGNFRRIYPAAAPPVQAKYEWLLQGSARMFASSMKAKAHNTIGRIQVGLSALQELGTVNMLDSIIWNFVASLRSPEQGQDSHVARYTLALMLHMSLEAHCIHPRCYRHY